MIEKQGHSVVAAEDGVAALAVLEKENFHLALMDVQMPQLNGFEVTAAIRARELNSHEHLSIIAMTALALKGDREKCLAAGMDDYVAKPLRGEDLRHAIERVWSLKLGMVLRPSSDLSESPLLRHIPQ